MTSRLNPYVGFAGNARQALEFYRDVFGGELALSTFGEYGEKDAPNADQIMHGVLETDRGFTLMGSDVPGGAGPGQGSNITISLSGDDAEALAGYWEKLSEGGTAAIPLEEQVWGDEFGMCVDQFGIPWMVNISQPEA